jgi:hypothetical protein
LCPHNLLSKHPCSKCMLGWPKDFARVLGPPQLCVAAVASETIRFQIVGAPAAFQWLTCLTGCRVLRLMPVILLFSYPLQLRQIASCFALSTKTAQVATGVFNIIFTCFCPECTHVTFLYRAATIVSNQVFALKL